MIANIVKIVFILNYIDPNHKYDDEEVIVKVIICKAFV